MEIELDDEIMTVNQDSELVIAQEIAKHLHVHAEDGSEYYWEIRNMHVNKKLGEPTELLSILVAHREPNNESTNVSGK